MVPLKNEELNKQLIPNLEHIGKYLNNALDFCRVNGMKYGIGSCSVPYCFLVNHIDKTIEFGEMISLFGEDRRIPNYNGIKGMSGENRGRELWKKHRRKVAACLKEAKATYRGAGAKKSLRRAGTGIWATE